MSTTSVLALTFGIGVIAGLRSLTAPAVVSWAARLHWFSLENTWAAFLGYASTAYIFAALALAELVNDKLRTHRAARPQGPSLHGLCWARFPEPPYAHRRINPRPSEQCRAGWAR